MSDPIEVLDFWLGEIGPEGWYLGSEEIDALCQMRFGELVTALQDEGLEHWVDGPAATLAYLIVADQFPRNIHRGTPGAFALDAKARAAARKALAEGWDLEAPPPERQFFYLPFEHSENMADQDLTVALMEERLADYPEQILHAKAHRELIRQFGRFPGRNAALGRQDTAEEADFNAKGGYPTLVERLRQAQIS